MKILITLYIFVFISFNIFAHSGDTVYVEQGNMPIIDGTISIGEWDDATIITYQAGFSGHEMTVTCYLKHNGTDTLYIAQHIPDMYNGDRNLITFDIEHNGSNNPQSDDFSCNRYHLEGDSYEGIGTGSTWNYSSPTEWYCNLTGEAWAWDGDLGEIEFAIAFSKLGIISATSKTIGFNIYFGELLGNYDPDVLWNWANNGDYFIPNSWGDMIISFPNNIKHNNNTFDYIVYPNPTTGTFTVKGEGIQNIEIINISG